MYLSGINDGLITRNVISNMGKDVGKAPGAGGTLQITANTLFQTPQAS